MSSNFDLIFFPFSLCLETRWEWEIHSIFLVIIVTTHTQLYRYYSLYVQRVLTILKHAYRIKRNIYIYSVRNFPPYPIWDVTNIIIGWLTMGWETMYMSVCNILLRSNPFFIWNNTFNSKSIWRKSFRLCLVLESTKKKKIAKKNGFFVFSFTIKKIWKKI